MSEIIKAYDRVSALLVKSADSPVLRAHNLAIKDALEVLRTNGAGHRHVAGTTAGLHIDTCAVCGHDLRHILHL